MGFDIDPTGVRSAWRFGEQAASDLDTGRAAVSRASSGAFGPLAAVLTEADDAVGGALSVAAAAVTDTGRRVQSCLDEYATTDDAEALEFEGLTPR